ncbi:helix-turn-helix domain-containing protein [Lachnospiraceae bacterium MD329]|nr:helix-turn-helix domain-containing protein [Lachnospiraceae bacterium MD329]
MNYITIAEASEKWGISERRIQKLCEENRIDGTVKFGRSWAIPKKAQKPVDARFKRAKEQENQ